MAGSPPDSKDSPLRPWQGRAGSAAVWASRGGRPGSSYTISSLPAGQAPGEAKMPRQMEGAPVGGGDLHTATQIRAPRFNSQPTLP